MEDKSSCGKGLAEHSALPAKVGELTAAVAEVLETHMGALDLTDESSRKEHDAYRELTKEHREIAERLQTTARKMADYRDLPMGRHDLEAMTDVKSVQAFRRFVALEQDLLALLQKRLVEDRKMLAEMGG